MAAIFVMIPLHARFALIVTIKNPTTLVIVVRLLWDAKSAIVL
jgi:hypothetical protein